MTREEAREAIKEAYGNSEYTDEIIKALDQEPTTKNETLVSFGAYKQVAWERDVAIEQLHELGYEFGQKIESTTKNDLGVDAVSRQEAIDTIRQLYLDLASQKAIIDILKVLPSVTSQEPRWIPVSEKLPNDRDWYLGIFKEPDTGWINPLPFICDYVGRETKETTKEHWILRGFTDWDDYHIDYYFNLECVAWMPLPKAYREVEG